LFGAAGAGAIPAIVATQAKGKARFGRMVDFFENVGKGETAGYGTGVVPKDPDGAKERFRKARLASKNGDLATSMGS
jgi:chlorophyllide a reductase subunit Y